MSYRSDALVTLGQLEQAAVRMKQELIELQEQITALSTELGQTEQDVSDLNAYLEPVEITGTNVPNTYYSDHRLNSVDMYAFGKIAILYFNLVPDATIPSTEFNSFVTIKTFNVSLQSDYTYQYVPCQYGSGGLTMSISSSGVLQIRNYSGVNITGGCRAQIPLMMA